MIHELKTEKKFFEDILNRAKSFEVRQNDRDFKTGDYCALNEYDAETQQYTGRSMIVRITYILSDERFVKEGFVTFGVEVCGVKTNYYMDLQYIL